MKQKRIQFYKFGDPQEVLRLEEATLQPPNRGEILVRMLTRPINPSDLIPIRGAYAHRIALPCIPGYEGVGIVEEVGASVSKDLLGKRVLPLRGEGTWQEIVKAKSEFAVVVPKSIDMLTAAQLYINPITAWVTLTKLLRLKANDLLLVNACGSAIGRMYAQLAKHFGIRLIGVTRSNKHTEQLIQLGAYHVINTSETPLYETVMELTAGRGVDAAIDMIGGTDGTNLAFCIAPTGEFLCIGLLSGVPINWKQINEETTVNAKLFHLRHWNRHVSVEMWHDTFQRVINLVENEQLKLMNEGYQVKLSDVKKAIHLAEQTESNGKVFLAGNVEDFST